MTDSAEEPTPPEGLPDTLVAELDDLTAEQLRNAIVHAQELLLRQEEPEGSIEPGPQEDILRVTEHDGYTEVVKQFTCEEGCSDCPHGPYLYHVREEPRPDGSTHVHWSFLGKINE